MCYNTARLINVKWGTTLKRCRLKGHFRGFDGIMAILKTWFEERMWIPL